MADEQARAGMKKVIDHLVKRYEENDLEGVAVVAVDSGYEIHTSAVSDPEASYEMIAGSRLLDETLMQAVRDSQRKRRLQ